MSSVHDLIITPLTEAACCTCAKWEGARVLLDGYCHNLSEAVGYCQHSQNEHQKPIWQLSRKLASEAACEDWSPAQRSNF